MKYLQLILMNLTVVGLSSSELGESCRHSDLADVQFEIPFCRKSRRGRGKKKVFFFFQFADMTVTLKDPPTNGDITLTCKTLSDTPLVAGESAEPWDLSPASVWTPSGTKSFCKGRRQK